MERLRDALLRIEHGLNYAGRTATEALKIAKSHEHGGLGDVLVPALPEYVGADSPAGFGPHTFNSLR